MDYTILGIPLSIALMWGAGIMYFIGAVLLWRPLRAEKGELMTALFAFLVSMTAALFLMGAGEYWKSISLGYLGTLAVMVGSVFMLKFPLTTLSQGMRTTAFRIIFIVVLFLFIGMLALPGGQKLMPNFVMWYMMLVNGVVVGFFIFFAGLIAKARWFKVKAVGGGAGIASCCVASHVASMFGVLLLSAIFQFLAPLIIVLSIFVGRHYQKKELPDF